jgi:hypothetical protein
MLVPGGVGVVPSETIAEFSGEAGICSRIAEKSAGVRRTAKHAEGLNLLVGGFELSCGLPRRERHEQKLTQIGIS